MEEEPQPSYSWWLNSHNKPKKFEWLQTTLADLDNKTKAMLSLIQEEADSFAKRADMYYTKRPELINLIEQFYRAHRSLAERYDHMKGETKQNAHKAVKFQHSLSCVGFLESPFAKDRIVANEKQEVISVHDSSASDSEISEVDNPEPQVYKIKNEENCDQDSESVNASTSSDSELDNPEPQVYKIKNEENSDIDNESMSALTSSDSELDNPVHKAAETENVNSRLREMEGRISYLEEENSRLLRRLTMKSLKSKHLKEKIRRLKKEKNYFKEELFFVDREKSLLQRESDIVKADYNKLRNENEAGLQQRQVLTKKVGNLQKKNQRLSKQNNVMSIVLGFVNGQAASMAGSRLRNENEAASQQRHVRTSMVSNLQKENQRLSKQNKAMSIVLGFINGQAASMARSNEMLRNEIQQGNQEAEAIIQNLKDEKRNADIMFEAEGKLVSEQNVKTEELQSEVRMVGNLQKKNQGLSEQNKVMSIVLGFVNRQAASMARSNVMLRNEIQQGNQEAEATIQNLKDEKRNAEIMFEAEGKLISEQNAKIEELQSEVRMVGNLQKKIQRLCGQNKVMSIVLGFVNGQAASMARSNAMLRNEIQQSNQEAEAIIQSLKDEKRNVELIFEAEGKLISEQNAKIEELQSEVRMVGNLQKKIQRLSGQNKVMSIVLGFVNGQAASMARSNVMLRNEIQQSNQEAEAIIQSLKDEKRNVEIIFEAKGKLVSEQNAKIELQSEVRMVGNLQKKIQRLSGQNKVMSIVLGFVNGHAASMARSNVMLRNEIQQGNQEAEAIIQSLKDEKRNVEIIFEAEGKLVSEQNAKIEELQSEVRILTEQNREQDIQLLERNEEKREVIRQLAFALDAQRDKNQRLDEALRNSRVAALCKVNTHDSAASPFSTWKKLLFAVRGGPRPQHNHIPGRCNFGSFYLNLCEKQTPKVLSLRE